MGFISVVFPALSTRGSLIGHLMGCCPTEAVGAESARLGFVESGAGIGEAKRKADDTAIGELRVDLSSADLKYDVRPVGLSIFVNGETAGNLAPSPREAPVLPVVGLTGDPKSIGGVEGKEAADLGFVVAVFVHCCLRSSRLIGAEGKIAVGRALG